MVALNKWDIIEDKDDKTYLTAIDNVRSNLPILRWAEVALISAKTGNLAIDSSCEILISNRDVAAFLLGLRTEKLFEAVDRAAKQFSRR